MRRNPARTRKILRYAGTNVNVESCRDTLGMGRASGAVSPTIAPISGLVYSLHTHPVRFLFAASEVAVGDIVVARCRCGYQSKQLFIGSGMMPRDRWLALCAHCREVVSVDVQEKRLRCPQCRRKPKLVQPERRRIEERGATLFPTECPSCGQSSLQFHFVGVWD